MNTLAVKKIIIFILSFFIIIFSVNFCFAADGLGNAFGGDGSPLDQAAGLDGAGYNTTAPVTVDKMISTVITTALSFIGVIFLVLMIYGGYIWMIARGNEQEVEKAKNIIIAAIIGLAVVLAAYAASWYIINVLGTTALKGAVTLK